MSSTKDPNIQNNPETVSRGDIHRPVVSGTATIIIEIEYRLKRYDGPPNMVVKSLLATIENKLAAPIPTIDMLRDMIQDNNAAMEIIFGIDLCVSLESIGHLNQADRLHFETTGEILDGSGFIDWRTVEK